MSNALQQPVQAEREQRAAAQPSPDPWAAPDGFIAELLLTEAQRPAQRLFRIGDGVLDICLSEGSTLDFLDGSYADCAVAVAPGDMATLHGRVVECPRRGFAALSIAGDAGLDVTAHLSDLLRHQHLGSLAKPAELPSRAAGWRLWGGDAGSPAIAASADRLLVDLSQQPWNLLARFLLSAVMRMQRGTLFVHAASVVIDGAGVLVAGASGAGKTTLSLGLAARGHDFYGENMAALRVGSGEILPCRRTALLRPGARTRAISALLAAEGIALAHTSEQVDAPPKLAFRTGLRYPGTASGPAPLGFAFFLRRFAERAALEPFVPDMRQFETVLRPLSFDILVAASWGAESGWLMKHLQLCAMLARVRCFHLDPGDPDETVELVERTVQEAS